MTGESRGESDIRVADNTLGGAGDKRWHERSAFDEGL